VDKSTIYIANFSVSNTDSGTVFIPLFYIREGFTYFRSQMHSPGMEDIVDYGAGLSYRPAGLYIVWRAGTTNPMPEPTLSPQPPSQRL